MGPQTPSENRPYWCQDCLMYVEKPCPRRRVVHDLKCHPEPFQAMLDGAKRHEFRRNDRDFMAGDELYEQEWDPKTETYTGRENRYVVTYISRGPEWGIPEGFCVMTVADTK